MSTIATSAHQANLTVTFNPGVIADPAFFALADNILMIEDTYDASKALSSIESSKFPSSFRFDIVLPEL